MEVAADKEDYAFDGSFADDLIFLCCHEDVSVARMRNAFIAKCATAMLMSYRVRAVHFHMPTLSNGDTAPLRFTCFACFACLSKLRSL
jgi:hypothetical protein